MTISLQSREPFFPPNDRHDRRMYGSDRSPEGTRKDRSGSVQRIDRLVDSAQRLDCIVHGGRSPGDGRKAVSQKKERNGYAD